MMRVARGQAAEDLPRLVVVYNRTVPALQLRETAAGVWRTVWLVDRTLEGVQADLRLLARLGPVVDMTGLDLDEAAQALARHEPAGIIAFSDAQLVIAASIATKLGLPGYSAVTVERLANKVEQRRALRAHGVASPQFRAVPVGTGAGRLDGIVRSMRYPAIIKPQGGAGSRDTYRLRSADDFLRVISRRETQADPVDLIVEELLADAWPRNEHPYADFVSVESIVARGRLSHLTVTGRATLAEPFLETGNFIPSNFPADVTEEIVSVATRAIAAMESETGVFHTEVKVTPDGPRVIEINGRVGGAGIPEMFALAGGHALYNIAGRVALGQAVGFDTMLSCTRVGYSMLITPPRGAKRLIRLGNLERVRQLPGVSGIDVNRNDGDPIDWRRGYESRLVTVLGVVDDHDAMWATRRQIEDMIDIEYE